MRLRYLEIKAPKYLGVRHSLCPWKLVAEAQYLIHKHGGDASTLVNVITRGSYSEEMFDPPLLNLFPVISPEVQQMSL